MSLDELSEDLKANVQAAKSLASDPEVTARQVMQYLSSNLLPLLENHVEETTAMADALDDVINEAGDMLQTETAGVFAHLIVSSSDLVAILKSRLGVGDQPILDKIALFEETVKTATAILEEVTVTEDDGDDDDDAEDGDDDEDDE